MKIKVKDEGKVQVPDESTVKTVLEQLDYHLDSVVVISEDEPLPLDQEVEEGMTLKIIPVVSGG